jgi:hypothetical protein
MLFDPADPRCLTIEKKYGMPSDENPREKAKKPDIDI